MLVSVLTNSIKTMAYHIAILQFMMFLRHKIVVLVYVYLQKRQKKCIFALY